MNVKGVTHGPGPMFVSKRNSPFEILLSNPVSKFPYQPSFPSLGVLYFPRMPTLASLPISKRIRNGFRHLS